MFAFFIFLFIFAGLFLLSPIITNSIYTLAFLLTRNRKISLGILLTILLPGTLIHELSHFLVATVLFVPAGEITLIPKVEGDSIKAGSVHHARTDPIRRMLIGIAPMIIGLTLIYVLGLYSLPQILNLQFSILNVICLYLLFITSISMFSSKKDLEVAWFLVPVFILLGASLYFAGFRVSFSHDLLTFVEKIVGQLDRSLFATLGIDVAVFGLLRVIVQIVQKVFGVRITHHGKN